MIDKMINYIDNKMMDEEIHGIDNRSMDKLYMR